MTRQELLSHLHRLGACFPAIEWVEKQALPPSRLWMSCPDTTWLAWLVVRVLPEARKDICLDVIRAAMRRTNTPNAYRHMYRYLRGKKRSNATEVQLCSLMDTLPEAEKRLLCLCLHNDIEHLIYYYRGRNLAQIIRRRVTWAKIRKGIEGAK